MKNIITIILLIFILPISFINAQSHKKYSLKIAKVKYTGGGDWYANKTALPNLAEFCNDNLGTSIDVDDEIVEIGSAELFDYSYIYLTGHGNVVFSDSDVENLRGYLISGGFMHIDDNYGLDKFIRLEMKKVFPNLDFVEIPHDHPIYHQTYSFPNGLPKIHEHDGKPAQGFGIFYEGRLVCYYSYESDLGNGWEDASIHNDPDEVRMKALQMGANIISFALTDF